MRWGHQRQHLPLTMRCSYAAADAGWDCPLPARSARAPRQSEGFDRRARTPCVCVCVERLCGCILYSPAGPAPTVALELLLLLLRLAVSCPWPLLRTHNTIPAGRQCTLRRKATFFWPLACWRAGAVTAGPSCPVRRCRGPLRTARRPPSPRRPAPETHPSSPRSGQGLAGRAGHAATRMHYNYTGLRGPGNALIL